MKSTVSEAGRYGNAALIAGRMLAAIGGLLLLAGTSYIWSIDAWNVRAGFLVPIVAALCLVAVALTALIAGRLLADLFALTATGWALAWNGAQLGGLLRVSTIQYHHNGAFIESVYGPTGIPWYLWAIAGVGLLLGVAALLLIAGIARGVRAMRGAAPEVLLAQATPPGWHSDPVGDPGVARWWNGTEWTTHTRHVAHT